MIMRYREIDFFENRQPFEFVLYCNDEYVIFYTEQMFTHLWRNIWYLLIKNGKNRMEL